MKYFLIFVMIINGFLVCSTYGLMIKYPESPGKNMSQSIEPEELISVSGDGNSESVSSVTDSNRRKRGAGHLVAKGVGNLAAKSALGVGLTEVGGKLVNAKLNLGERLTTTVKKLGESLASVPTVLRIKRGVGHLIAKGVGHLAAKSIVGGGLLKAGGKLVKAKTNLGGKLVNSVRNLGKENKAICETRVVEKEKEHCETADVEECVTEFEEECKQEYTRECTTENKRKCKMEHVTKCDTESVEKCEDDVTRECREEEKEECNVEYEEECWEEKEVVERRCSITNEKVCSGKVSDRSKRSDEVSMEELENMSARDLLEVVDSASTDDVTDDGVRNKRGAHAVVKHAGKKAVLASKVLYKLRNLFKGKVPEKCETVPQEHCIEVPVEECSDNNKQCHFTTTTKCAQVPKEEKCWVKPHEVCHDVTNTKCWLEPREKCWEEPVEKCWDEEVEKCWDEPHEKCWKVPVEKCTSKPHTTCVAKKVEVPEKWCRMENGKW